ncbi:MAG: hypothetical protein D3923_12275 [Candidatus Electrothrix sp. AR3]|nr:hypothetical protein [Candidatus Electrothrix sp. AR3]
MQKTSFSLILLAAVLICSSWGEHALAKSLDATVKKSEREYRKTADGEGALTKQMIEDCITFKIDIEAEYLTIADSKKQFDVLNTEVSELGAYLQKNKAKASRSAAEDIAEYQEKTKRYNSKLAELNKQKEAYDTMSAPYREKNEKFKKECKGQPYYEDEYTAIVKKMGRGM